jgi:homocysteine S-methyltransferase
LNERALVCDGAMGTVLYARGVFINRCFDALNLQEPDMVSDIHQDYVRAGADVIETNTFGANRIKLRAFGLADQLTDINVAGARLARLAANERVYVAGAIGPLGVRIEPWGRIGVDEVEEYFREQVEGLVEGGVDLFILETFRDLNELSAAIAAVRQVCDKPVVAQMTIEEDGNSLDGTPPEQFAPALDQKGADVVGVNCSIGPAPMLETIERMAVSTSAPLSGQPNAGKPRDIEGRNIYLSSPEYMASYARRFLQRGVRLVGGCCGTTPAHIAQIVAAVKSVTPAASRVGISHRSGATTVASSNVTRGSAASVVPLVEKSSLAARLASKKLTTIVELLPPKGPESEEAVNLAQDLKARGIDVVSVLDRPRGARMSALSLAVLVQQQAGVETILQYSCRDRNLLGMQSDLLGAHAMGLRNLLVVTGDARRISDYPDATAVFDVDSIGLANVVVRLNHGLDVGGHGLGSPTAFHVGVRVNPGAEDLDAEIRRFEYKVEAGAEFAVTTPVFDVGTFERLQERFEVAGLPVIVGLWPFENALNAEFMANEVPGVHVPESVVERMRRFEEADAARAEGVAIAREVGIALREKVRGIYVAVPGGRVKTALDVVEGIRE